MKPIKIDSFLDYKYVSDPRWSAGGGWISYWVKTADLEKDRYRNTLCLLKGDGTPGPNLPDGLRPAAVLWHPTEEKLVMELRAGKNRELMTWDPATNRLGDFPSPPRADGKLQFLTPDSMLLTVTDTVWDHAVPEYNYEVYTESPFRSNGVGITEGRRKHLYRFDLKTKALTPIWAPEDESVTVTAVSPAGALLFASTHIGGTHSDRPSLWMWKDGQLTQLLERGQWFLRQLAWLDGRPVFAGSKGEVWGHYQYDGFWEVLEPEKCRLICTFETNVGSSCIINDLILGAGQMVASKPDGVWFVSSVDDRSYLYKLEADGRRVGPLTDSATVNGFDVHEGKIVFCGIQGQDLAELYFADNRKLTAHNDLSGSCTLSVPQPLAILNEQGTRLQGWVMPPVGYEPGKKYPGILTIHGGPHNGYSAVGGHEMQVWANAGYFVFYCNPRGSDTRGNAYNSIPVEGTIDYKDLMDFTDAALERWQDIDVKRLAVVGGSYGGLMTNWIITHTNRFAAACSLRCISNMVSQEGTSDIGYYSVFGKKSIVTGQADLRWEMSPLRYAQKAKTPTLFIHSEEDYRCPMQEAFQMFYALRQNGVDSRLAFFHGEEHSMLSTGRPRSRIGCMAEELNWLDKYLK